MDGRERQGGVFLGTGEWPRRGSGLGGEQKPLLLLHPIPPPTPESPT